jgi:ATP-dependent Lhr-like helicase
MFLATTDSDRCDEALDGFLPPVASWFRETLGEPTLPQRLGWPSIAAGNNTLIVAPTGSGKTLAAFLQALDLLWRPPRRLPGVRVLYVSPLKALNEDIRRNLELPLEGILEHAADLGMPLQPLRAAVRSGDTPARDRARLLRKPPDILITTPESLHLMLTSRAREVLRGISHVIVDEIHAVCGNKRGVFLALLLERLEAICPASFVRIGLSATQRPLEEVARYLGGQRLAGESGPARRFEPRPVTIIDAGRRKEMDLQVLWPGPDDARLTGPPGSIWPAIEERILALARGHRSTIVFANSRRVVERLTAHLNEALETEDEHRDRENSAEPDPVDNDESSSGWFRAHHGSLSLEERQATEGELKRGILKGVVSTASLELGIDMGEVDLVCQVESPGNVARGLQRVGRAGHVVHGVSKGRLIAKTHADLLETAALAQAMVEGNIEPLRVPHGCLDVLAQQVVACVAMDRCTVPEVFDLVRGAYPYEDFPAEAFESVLSMVSGRFSTGSIRDLRGRISWDRIHNRLAPLPGSARLALLSGGTIPDTGQYPVVLGDDGPRLGELDEEFVFERRVGETFALGNNTWRIDAIEPHRVVVRPAEGTSAVMPFWRGEQGHRSPELGQALGALCGRIAADLDEPELAARLESECRLEPRAARALIRHVLRQRRIAGVVPDDRTILVETFRDPAGELGLAVLSPLGGRVHQALKIALLGRIRQRYGFQASCLHGNDGLLLRLPRMETLPLDLLDGFSADEAERLIRLELPETALYGLRFRQNAARALLMPRPDPAKRTPLWLQRLRAKDLLQVVGPHRDFPIVVETFRECLNHDLELPRLRRLLDDIAAGTVRVVTREGEIASPFASELIFKFTPAYLYEWDEPRRGDLRPGGPGVDEDLLNALLQDEGSRRLLDPQAIGRVEGRLRRRGLAPRSAEEMAELLRSLGDLTPEELFGPMATLLEELRSEGRAVLLRLHSVPEPGRWISAEESRLYDEAFPTAGEPDAKALETIVKRYLDTHALIGMDELTRRFPIAPEVAGELLERWVEAGRVVRLDPEGDELGPRWVERSNMAEIHRLSVAIRRRESVAVAPEVFADFLVRRQHLHSATRMDGLSGLEHVLERLSGFAATAGFWEEEILPRRIPGYRPGWLDDLLAQGGWTWRACRDGRDEPRVAIVPREFVGTWPEAPESEASGLTASEQETLALLTSRGATFATDLARLSSQDPSRQRRALLELMARGLITNDRFDPLRAGGDDMLQALVEASSAARANGRSLRRQGARRINPTRPEGRWSLVEAGAPGESHLLAWIAVLLERYGVLTRDLVALDPWAPTWAELQPLLARAELRGELRRGYFVEGLSGIQYAEAHAADALTELASAAEHNDQDVLVAAADPANLYGSGAPLDIPLLEGGTARLSRLPGNFLVLQRGRPVLVIEGGGKRLTGLASASEPEIRSALHRLVDLAQARRHVLKVETYNGEPAVSSPAATALSELGFVRDYPGMTYYATWSRVATGQPRA